MGCLAARVHCRRLGRGVGDAGAPEAMRAVLGRDHASGAPGHRAALKRLRAAPRRDAWPASRLAPERRGDDAQTG
jgi:hypothetical protein